MYNIKINPFLALLNKCFSGTKSLKAMKESDCIFLKFFLFIIKMQAKLILMRKETGMLACFMTLRYYYSRNGVIYRFENFYLLFINIPR